tara:strand:- start:247 stop:549 length:303 start_codon:yes stop_codon:yes gene_type:complete
MVIASEPEVALDPLQAPDALHVVALAVDQVRVVSFPARTDSGSAVKFTVALGNGGGVGSEEPPPPPPPHETRTTTLRIEISFCLEFINAGLFIILKKTHL